MVNNHRTRISLLAALPRGLLFACSFCLVVSTASAQGKMASAPAPTPLQPSRDAAARGDAGKPSSVKGKVDKSADKLAETVEDLAVQLKELQDVQTGLVLTLAACGDEPHCVSGVNDQEIASMQERLLKATQQLEQEAPEKQETLRQALQALQEGAAKLRVSVTQVETEIDRTKLEGNWSDQFVFDDFNAASAVPFPNEKVPLVRFEDAEQPLPLE
ncbi:hypothetical protein P3G55_15945 [Leptospira sp. 96542]|nr:hypothetical protein [Leptospira sp. 96542]